MRQITKNTMYGEITFPANDYIASKCDTHKWYHGKNCHTTDMISKINSMIKSDSTFVDVGAFVGTFSIPLLEAGHCGFMFEACKDFYNMLSINTRKYDKATSYNNAVGNKNISIGMSVENGNFGGSHITKGNEIKMITLDSFFTNSSVNQIDFIKIDVESYEYYVLQGAVATISRFKPIILWENLKPNWNDTSLDAELGKKENCFEFLQNLGYNRHQDISNNILSFIE